jgi:hypothetical protein
MKISFNNVNLVVISQCNFHHSTIQGMPEDSAVDQRPEETEAIPARWSKTLQIKLFVKEVG